MNTPEIQKSLEKQSEWKVLKDFLSWLSEKSSLYITTFHDCNDPHEDYYEPTSKSNEQIIANYLGIDLQKIKEEEQKVLEAYRLELKKRNEK